MEVAHPGSVSPSTSVRQPIVFAVPNMAHVPGPGQATCSISDSSSRLILPVWARPMNSRMSVSVRFVRSL